MFLKCLLYTVFFFPWAAVADAGLDAKLVRLHAEVARQFRFEPYPGMPEPRMISQDLFSIAMKSYCGLLESPSAKGVSNRDRLTIVDLNLDGKSPRLYIYDIRGRRMIRNTWTSHGSNSELYFYQRIGNTDFNLRGTLNEPVVSFRASAPAFFGNDSGSGLSSVGMAIAHPGTYWSDKRYFGIPQGNSVRLTGVDGNLNDRLQSRGVVVHRFDFHTGSFSKVGAPTSEGCLMIDKGVADSVMGEMLGAPVILYHDRLFPEHNEKAYRDQLAVLSRLASEISLNLKALGHKYHWNETAIVRNEAKLKAQLKPLRIKIEATYQYFKNDSRYITFEPNDPATCAQVLGL